MMMTTKTPLQSREEKKWEESAIVRKPAWRKTTKQTKNSSNQNIATPKGGRHIRAREEEEKQETKFHSKDELRNACGNKPANVAPYKKAGESVFRLTVEFENPARPNQPRL